MKNNFYILVAAVLVSSLGIKPSAWAQGSLTPPGAPAPTMKTADQIYAKLDPRIAVGTNTTPGDANNLFIISQPGSYYLTTNIVGVSGKSGIEIIANNVTLDLNGFTLQGVSGTLGGVVLPNSNTNIFMHDGNINGWAQNGVFSLSSVNVVLERLNVSANLYAGVYNFGDIVIRDCVFSGNSGEGISSDNGPAQVFHCKVKNNGGRVILQGSIKDSDVSGNGAGIFIEQGGSVTDCTVTGNQTYGIYADDTFRASGGNQVTGNLVSGNNLNLSPNGGGIVVRGAGNQIENNHLNGNGVAGIVIDPISHSDTGNIIVKNSASKNGAINYSVPSGNVFGPIANDNTGAITNSSPWANFSF